MTLPNVCADAVSATHFYMASESPTFTGATWEPYASVPLFILSSGSGVKTVYFKVKDQTNAESDVTSDTITLEGSGFSVEAWGYFPSQAVLPSPNSGFIAVSEGTSHYLGLRSNGSIVAWGSTTSPIPNNGFVAVAAGDLHSLGLKSDGSIVAWGNDTYGQCSVPSPNQNFVAVAAGVCFSLGLKSDGSIVAWGKNVAGQCNVPSPNQGFVAISAGETHSLGLKSDGSVVAWGNNFYEQCTLPTPNSDFVTISTGNRHNLGLKANGSVVAWGDRTYGQLSIPAPNNSFVAIEGKSLNSVGLKTDGSIVVWGNNDHGQCIVPSPNSGFVALGGGGGGGGGRHILALRVEGILKVTLTPRQAVSAGAQWRLVNETPGLWHDSGTSQSLYPRNNYWIEYKMIRGWQEPMSQIISIEKDQRLSLTGLYQNIPTCSLTTNVTHGYLVTSPKRPDYPVGTTVTLCVRARQGYRFSGWTGDVQPGLEMTNPLTLTMDTTKTLNATFEPVPRGSVQAWGRNSDGQCSIRSPNNDYIALAAGRSHSLGLKCDGSIVAWGRNTEGQCTIPTPNSDFVAIAAGDLHSLGLKSDGSIVAWGSNLYGQCNVPVPNSGFVDLAGGETHSLGLKSDGTIVAWGRNDSGQCSTPSPNGNFVALAAGRAHNLGLHSDGSIVAWGNNTSDQCTIPPPNTGFVSVAAGDSHSLGLKSDGSILIWGSNPYGEGTVPSPNSNFTDVSTGVYSHCLGLKSDGSIMAWGDNTYGQRNVPGPNIGFLDLAVGKYHSLALVPCYDLLTQSTHGNISRVPDQTSYARGTMVTLTAQPDDGCWFDCWTGDVPYGLGRRNPVAITMDTHKTIRMDAGTGPLPPPPVITTFSINNGAPTTVNPAVTLPNICSGVTTSSAVYYMASELSDFTDTTWQLYASIPLFTLSEGNGLKTVYFIVKNSAGVESAVTSDTITLSGPGFPIVGWGINSYGAYTVPSPNNDFVAIEAGYYHTLGLKTDGSIAAWGYNGSGQCTIPSSNNSFVAIAVGGEHSLGLKSNGSIVAWGYNGSTQCTIPAPNNGFVTVAAGYSHSLGLKSDGSVVAWGSNWAGQCTVPSPNSGFVAVSAGWAHSVGLKADGSIVTWGFNATVPTLNSGFVAISAGYEHNLGLKSDSSIVAWGRNTQGECNVPQPNTGYVSIEAGSTHNLALKLDGSIVAWGRTIGGPCTIPVPNSGFVAISAGDSFSLAMASEKMGSLKVALTPADAVITGAQWRLTSETQGVWHNSGDTVRVRGEQRLTFKEIHGWNKPEDQSVNVTTESAVSKTANYTPVTWTLSTLCSSDTLQTVPSGAHFFHGTTVTLTALPQADCWFDHWTGDVPERLKRVNPLILTMDDNKTIGVDFDSGVPPSAPVIWNFSINNGAATTANPVVTLSNTCTDVTSASATHYLASESSDFTSSTWQSYATVPLFTLSSGSGVKTVYLKVRNSALVESSVTSDTITLIGPNLSIAAWGANRNFQCGTPSPNNNFLALAAGGQHSMGLKSDSSIVAWGDRVYGQCRVPLPNRDFVALAAGYRHSLGLKSDGSI
ncbi:MAG TPA: hypothetical protein PLA90_11415, partial [Candidatus Sumerlaeota bacterium]|nr:hypothetical protein [Candidatus Sumerlaeota bacterium]